MENIIFYLSLYLVIIAIRWFKLKSQLKDAFKNRSWEVLHVSLEVVFTASGLVIALLINVPKNWVAPVVMIYIFFVIVAALLEMSNSNFSLGIKTVIHGTIIFGVIIATVCTFNYVIKKSDINGHKIDDSSININSTRDEEKTYFVIIPYVDHSLNKHVGAQNMINKYFISEIYIKDIKPDSVGIKAMSKILKDTLIRPIYPSKTNGYFDDIQFVPSKSVIIEKKSMIDFYGN